MALKPQPMMGEAGDVVGVAVEDAVEDAVGDADRDADVDEEGDEEGDGERRTPHQTATMPTNRPPLLLDRVGDGADGREHWLKPSGTPIHNRAQLLSSADVEAGGVVVLEDGGVEQSRHLFHLPLHQPQPSTRASTSFHCAIRYTPASATQPSNPSSPVLWANAGWLKV
jgi:hypothetical protein